MTREDGLRRYFRPRSLLFGADARAAIATGRGGALGGLPNLAFTEVEIISRFGATVEERRVEQFWYAKDIAVVQRSVAPRPAFAGLAMDGCRIMGIVNVTPDSFSDGGTHDTEARAIAHGRTLAEEGADILDIGGESTRPGSDTVDDAEEERRVLPVIRSLAAEHLVSADTRKAAIMQKALAAGAGIINDVSALTHDAASAGVVAQAGVPVVLMHAQGQPKTMQLNPHYDDVLLDVYDALRARVDAAVAAGIPQTNICVDPGIGFGKTFQQNLQVMAGLTLFHGLGVPLLVGLSRKGVVGAVTGETPAGARVHGSVGGALAAALQGAHILRVHDVKATKAALSMFTASLDPDSADV